MSVDLGTRTGLVPNALPRKCRFAWKRTAHEIRAPMSQENVETVRRVLEAFAGDRPTWLSLHDENHVVTPSDSWPEAGEVHGRDAAWAFYRDVIDAMLLGAPMPRWRRLAPTGCSSINAIRLADARAVPTWWSTIGVENQPSSPSRESVACRRAQPFAVLLCPVLTSISSTSPASRSIISSRPDSSGRRLPTMQPRTSRKVLTASSARSPRAAQSAGIR
jgi:hypothetical protein